MRAAGRPPSTHRPGADPRRPVAIAAGISTEAIWEQAEVGEDVATVAELYDLTVPEVRWALSYENSVRAA